MTDYEKGTRVTEPDGSPGTGIVRSPLWEIGQVITRHEGSCAKVLTLRRNAHTEGLGPQGRMDETDLVACTCGHDLRMKQADEGMARRYGH